MRKISYNSIAISLAALLFTSGVASAAYVDYNTTDGFILGDGLTLRNNSSITFTNKAVGAGDFELNTMGSVQLRFASDAFYKQYTTSTACTATGVGGRWDTSGTSPECKGPLTKKFSVVNADVTTLVGQTTAGACATAGGWWDTVLATPKCKMVVFSIDNNGKLNFGHPSNRSYFQVKQINGYVFLEAATGNTGGGQAWNNGFLIRRANIVGTNSTDFGMISVSNNASPMPNAAYLGYKPIVNNNLGLFVGQAASKVTGNMTVTDADLTLAGMGLTVTGNLILPTGILNFAKIQLAPPANSTPLVDVPSIRLFANGSVIQPVSEDLLKTYSFAAKNYYIVDSLSDNPTFCTVTPCSTPTTATTSSVATLGWINQVKPAGGYKRFIRATATEKPKAHVDWSNIFEVAKMNGTALTVAIPADIIPLNQLLTMNAHVPY